MSNKNSVALTYNVTPYTLVKSIGVIYKLILTGTQDGTTDLEIPLNSYYGIIKNGYLSTHTFQTTLTDGMLTDINDRQNGDLQIYRQVLLENGTESMQLFMEANFNSATKGMGSSSGSITIKGSKTVTNLAPKTVAIDKVNVWGVNSYNEREFSIESYSVITAGDVAVVDEENILIRQMTINIRPDAFSLKLTEEL